MIFHSDVRKTSEDIQNAMSSANVFQPIFRKTRKTKNHTLKGVYGDVFQTHPQVTGRHGRHFDFVFQMSSASYTGQRSRGGDEGRILKKGDGMPSIAVSKIDIAARSLEEADGDIGGESTERSSAPSLKASDLTEIDRRQVTLWRVYARWDGAVLEERMSDAETLALGFVRRLHDYEAACQAQMVQAVLA